MRRAIFYSRMNFDRLTTKMVNKKALAPTKVDTSEES